MKGVLMNVVEEAVSAEWGDDMWDDLLSDCDLQGAYTALGNYSDADILELAEAASVRLDAPLEDVVRILGRLSFPGLIGRNPAFLEGASSVREFLPRVNDIIHPEVLKLYPGASVPRFALREDGDDLEMDYESVRDMCMLAEGLVLGVADQFGESVTVHQTSCKHRGDARCVIRIEGAA